MKHIEAPIGVFDSGVGGISVLRELVALMPQEDFIYIGDSIHAPYGTKPHDEVHQYVLATVEKLLKQNVKIIVIACNTATSVSIRALRPLYPQVHFVGIEPAIKPAAEKRPDSRVLVMATPMTLSEEKFQKNVARFQEKADFIPVPCPGLMELIEGGHLSDAPAREYLTRLLTPYFTEPVGAIVLGCTHYPFIRGLVQEIAGSDVLIVDGSAGTARETRRQLEAEGLLRTDNHRGTIILQNTAHSRHLLTLSQKLLTMKL